MAYRMYHAGVFPRFLLVSLFDSGLVNLILLLTWLQDRLVPLDPFRPRPVTAEDRDAGLCTVSQYPTQAANMVSGHAPQQFLSQSQGPTNSLKVTAGNCLCSLSFIFSIYGQEHADHTGF